MQTQLFIICFPDIILKIIHKMQEIIDGLRFDTVHVECILTMYINLQLIAFVTLPLHQSFLDYQSIW